MPTRMDYITNEMSKLGTTIHYFDAITPKDLTMDDYSTLSTINNPKSYIYKKYTRLAVLLSFLMCFMDSVERKYKTIIIFEDDVVINVPIDTLRQSLTDFHESSFDIFYMGYCFLKCRQPVNRYKSLIGLTNPNLLCCQAMCIKTDVLPGLVDYCLPMKYNSDELFRNYYKEKGVKVCVPPIVYFTQNRKNLSSENQSIDHAEFHKTCIWGD
jgi:hypothetical protein